MRALEGQGGGDILLLVGGILHPEEPGSLWWAEEVCVCVCVYVCVVE